MLYFDFINPYVVYASYVLFTVFSIYVIFQKRNWVEKNKNTIYIVAAILLTWTQLARYLGVYLQGNFTIQENLPFYMCRISAVVLTYFAYTRDKRLYSFLFYWGALGLAGVIYPNGEIPNIANLTETFFIDHYLLTLIPFFLVAIEGYKPSRNDMFYITGLMALILFAFIPINSLLGSDYFYIQDQSIFGIIFPGAPMWVFIIVHSLTAMVFFNFYYMWFGQKTERIEKVSA